MKTVDILRRAGRSLRGAKARTLLTSLAIAVGAFTITLALAAGEGTRQYTDKLIGSNVNPQLLFIVRDKTLFERGAQQTGVRVYDPNVGMANGYTLKQLTQADIDQLKARDDLEQVVPMYNIAARYMRFEGNDTRFSADVTTYDATVLATAAAGTLPSLGQQIGDDEVVMPESFVTLFQEQGIVKEAKELIGKTIVLTIAAPASQPTTEEITAAFTTGGEAAVTALTAPETKEVSLRVRALSAQSSMSLGTASSALQVSAEQAREIAEFTTSGTDNYQKYISVTALATAGNDPAEVKSRLEADGFAAQTARDLQDVIFMVVNVMQGIVIGFGVLALIASVFGIINTQYISVLERTQQIGLMKALGMRGRHVLRLFQFEAAWIGLIGGSIGALVAIAAGQALNPWINQLLELGEGNNLLVFLPLPVVLLVVILVVVAMLAGWFPARKAAKLDPIEALRTE